MWNCEISSIEIIPQPTNSRSPFLWIYYFNFSPGNPGYALGSGDLDISDI